MTQETFEPIAIIGAGALFPGSPDRESYWASICHAEDRIGPIPAGRWDPKDHYDPDPAAPDRVYADKGGFLSEIPLTPAEFGLSPTGLQATDTSQLLSLWATRRLILEAGFSLGEGIPGRSWDRTRTSVILGVTGAQQLMLPLGTRLDGNRWKKILEEEGVDGSVANRVVGSMLDLYPPWLENSFPGLLGNVVAGRIAHRFNLGGSNCVVDAACASSLAAIHMAVMELQAGKSDLVISGGVDTFNDPFMYACFSKTPALSKTGAARPFDKDADGTILGEGVGLVLLKRLDKAQRDGDNILGVIKGMGASSDGLGSAVHAPRKEGQIACLRAAHASAGIDPATIGLVEAHGTGTKVGDATELAGLIDVFSATNSAKRSHWCALGSVKSQIGHTKAAAGAAGLIKALLAVRLGVIPPTVKVREPQPALRDPNCPFYIADRARPWVPATAANGSVSPRRAGVSAFGFGGSNYHLILEQSPTTVETPVTWDPDVWFAALSSPTEAGLVEKLTALQKRLGERHPSLLEHEWAQIVARETRGAFRSADPFRISLVGSVHNRGRARTASPADLVAKALRNENDPGIHRGSGPVRGAVALLFPGQGSQEPDMLLRLAIRFPEMREMLARTESHFANRFPGNEPLSRVVYPIRAFAENEMEIWRSRIRDTRYAQVALAGLSLGAFRVLERFGVKAQAAAGHSLGEWTALAAAGRITPDAMLELVAQRASLMSQSGSPGVKVRGAMLAVLAPEEQARQVLETIRSPLSLANRNSPTQVVFAGPREMVDRAHVLLTQQGIRSVILDVADAFHTQAMVHAVAPLQEALESQPFGPGAFPVFANVTAREYPAESGSARALLASQLAQPVQWAETLANLAAKGVDTFIECGPSRKLSGLVAATLGDAATPLAIDPSGGIGLAPLAHILAHLASRGHAVNLEAWDAGEWEQRIPTKSAFVVPVAGGLVRPKTERPKVERPKVETTMAEPKNPIELPKAQAPVLNPVKPTIVDSPTGNHRDAGLVPPRKAYHPVASMDSQHNTQQAGVASSGTLAFSRETLAALQQLQEQTARLHRQFLEGQELAQRTLQSLIETQLRGGPAHFSVAPVVAPQVAYQSAPVVQSAPPAVPAAPVAAVVPVVVAPKPVAIPVAPAPVAVAAPKPVEIAVPVVSAPVNSGALKVLTRVVAEKTGYPEETLEPDMALDTDLGIDSIKRVEILSAVQEALPGAPAVGAEHMGTLRTLRQLADHLSGGPPAFFPERSPREQGASQPAFEVTEKREGAAGLPQATEPRLAPSALSRFRLLDRDVPSNPPPSWIVPGTRVVVLAEDAVSGGPILEGLRNLGARADLALLADPASLPERLEALVIVAGFSNNPLTPRHLEHRALAWVQVALNPLSESAQRGPAQVCLLAAEPEGDGLPSRNALVACGLAGLVKTVRWEARGVCAQVIRVRGKLEPSVTSWIGRPGLEELVLKNNQARVLFLSEGPVAEGHPAPIRPGDLVLVTGGARGVTAVCALELAKTLRPHLVLCGRTPLPEVEPQWLDGIEGESEVRKAIAAHSPTKLSPKQILESARAILAAREVRNNLEALRAAGSQAEYVSLDVTDASAVRGTLGDLVRRHGPICGIVHGAGILADAKLVDKTPAQMDSVLAAKLDGLIHVLSATDLSKLGFISLFGSSTGRFGRLGQADYAIANESLATIARWFGSRFPSCSSRVVDWGPWEGGMVHGGLKAIFAAEGVGLIPLVEGARFLTREICSGPEPLSEVVALAPNSRLPELPAEMVATPRNAVSSKTQSVGQSVISSQIPDSAEAHAAPPPLEKSFDRHIDLSSHPVLADHVLDGRPVVPTAFLAEWLGQAACHTNPGYQVTGFDDLRVLHGVKLEGSRPVDISAFAARLDFSEAEEVTVRAELRGPRGSQTQAPLVRASILLAPMGGRAIPSTPSPAPRIRGDYPYPQSQWYSKLLFHGPSWQGINAIEGYAPLGSSEPGIICRVGPSPAPSAWMKNPHRSRWILDPLALDCAFQMMILYSQAQLGMPCLPSHVASFRQFHVFPADGCRAVLRIRKCTQGQVLGDIDFVTLQGLPIARMEGVESIADPALAKAFVRNQAALS
jgi:acyl transferase domain-containing protein/NAD(P)-dependent dehydrogenase (short-subunit alcohol dehydrogenase family)